MGWKASNPVHMQRKKVNRVRTTNRARSVPSIESHRGSMAEEVSVKGNVRNLTRQYTAGIEENNGRQTTLSSDRALRTSSG